MIVVCVEESRGDYPGHMIVGREREDGSGVYFGFRFDVENVPPAFRDPSGMWKYLLDHTVPGDIVNEELFLNQLRTSTDRRFHTKRSPDQRSTSELVPPPDMWDNVARYSFNPDDFHRPDDPCYNCVTWATMIANRHAPGMLVPIRQGRIAAMVRQLSATAGGEDNEGG